MVYNKEYYYKIKNKSKKIYDETYRRNNKQKIKESNKKYNKTPAGHKSNSIKCWKYRGLKLFGYTYDEVYEYYLDCDNCEVCNKDLTEDVKCMDHCHDTGIFRWILCKSCNVRDNWQKIYFG